MKKYWSIFDDKGLHVPVKDYECIIDTGNHSPVVAWKINYGPREIPIMEKAIGQLLELRQIYQIFHSSWLAKAVLAPKPHQEHVTDIDDFVWQFCVNYTGLNAVTKVISFPIPRCDSAVGREFGRSKFRWLTDAKNGFNQIPVAPNSQEKLAFAGPNATVYTYRVMPFGPVNGPVIFIIFAHDMDARWKEVAKEHGITIDEHTNSRLIVDDIFSWAKTLDSSFIFMECQFMTCLAQNLSLSLQKSVFFPERMEFVGQDVCDDGNRPAQSKHDLLKTWPVPTIGRDIQSFIGFVVYYQSYIPYSELRLRRLRHLTTIVPPDSPVGAEWDTNAQEEFDDLRNAILKDPCLARFDHTKRCYLSTDFSALGFGYCLTQPADDDASLAAMNREMVGGECEFLRDNSPLKLRPVAFGSRKTRGRENKLHSYLGEGFAGDWAMNRVSHYLWGMWFTWITDSYGIRFILTYEGANPVVLRLQMRLMLQMCNIVHRNNKWLGDADYWSRLGTDANYDPLVTEYLQYTAVMRHQFPVDVGDLKPENMPGYRQPRVSLPKPNTQSNLADSSAINLFNAILTKESHGHSCLSNVPVFIELRSGRNLPPLHLNNDDIPALAADLSKFRWVVYGFNSGHFAAAILLHNISFKVVLAVDPNPSG